MTPSKLNPDAEEKWTSGIAAEIDFWKRWLADLGPGHFRLNPDYPLQPFVTENLTGEARDRQTVDLLEVGSGPLCGLGKRWGDKTLNITAVDPLADAYAALLDDVGIAPAIPVVAGKGEDLLHIFGDQPRFDFAYCANALDHALDPALIIGNMLTLLRPGASLIFSVYQNEGLNSGYHGLHQWNFDVFQERIVLWNQWGISFLEEFIQPHKYTFVAKPYQDRQHFTVHVVRE
jgi:SAM-dependent methyltransferase